MSKFKQFSLIISGFALGQGSMFLAQTWLVVQEQFELLASIGIGLGILSLLQWAADCGGIYLLPKQLEEENFQQKFWAFVAARLVFSILFIALVLVALNSIAINAITYSMVLYGSLSAIIWSFNIAGILDSKQLNRIAGPMSGLCWVFAAIPVVALADSKYLGETIGIAFSLGLLVTLLIQFKSIRQTDINLAPCVPHTRLIKEQFIKGSTYNGAYISSQAYGRIIPILVDKLIDSFSAGIYVYAKNIANTVSQFVEFSRRVEFSTIVRLVRANNFDIRAIITGQKLSISIITAFFALTALAYVALYIYDNQHYLLIAQVTLILIAILFLWGLSSALGQALVALEKTGYYALIIALTLLSSLLIIFSSIEQIGLTGIYLGESLMFILQIFAFVLHIQKHQRLCNI
ncbi:MAG: hypothetical protein R3240_05570 [Gammaproteobacteria bacterium]|nr:hypothetical protein [Gammaproteobacteria bacterium]